ncbi:MAG: hypothetical protein ABSF69_19265 [Polyangiaceae bacterium]
MTLRALTSGHLGETLTRMGTAPKEYLWCTPNKTHKTIVIELPEGGDIPDWNEFELRYTNDKDEDVTVDTGDMTTARGEIPPKGVPGRLVQKPKPPTGSKAVRV